MSIMYFVYNYYFVLLYSCRVRCLNLFFPLVCNCHHLKSSNYLDSNIVETLNSHDFKNIQHKQICPRNLLYNTMNIVNNIISHICEFAKRVDFTLSVFITKKNKEGRRKLL